MIRNATLLATAIIVLAAIYLYGLEHAPVYLGGDEAHFGVHGYAMAQDGRNLGTRLLVAAAIRARLAVVSPRLP